jgi:hypothetical protein
VARVRESYTGQYLRELLGRRAKAMGRAEGAHSKAAEGAHSKAAEGAHSKAAEGAQARNGKKQAAE